MGDAVVCIVAVTHASHKGERVDAVDPGGVFLNVDELALNNVAGMGE